MNPIKLLDPLINQLNRSLVTAYTSQLLILIMANGSQTEKDVETDLFRF